MDSQAVAILFCRAAPGSAYGSDNAALISDGAAAVGSARFQRVVVYLCLTLMSHSRVTLRPVGSRELKPRPQRRDTSGGTRDRPRDRQTWRRHPQRGLNVLVQSLSAALRRLQRDEELRADIKPTWNHHSNRWRSKARIKSESKRPL